jgi:heme/copper-type cytochrome/quinol oxidase subunit 4
MPNEIIELLPLLAPLLLVQLTLQIVALIHLRKRESVRFGNKWIWVAIIVLGTLLGSIAYFVFGGGADERGSDD